MDEDVHVFDGSSGHDPVTEIEYVAAAPPALRRISLTCSRTWPAGPKRAAGSRFPWTAQLPPIDSRALSMGTRQSTPMTSPPASCIRGSRWQVSTPKWMLGTDLSRDAKRRFMWSMT